MTSSNCWWRCLAKFWLAFNNLHVQRVQHLKPEDFPGKVHFCEWLCAKNTEDPQFVTMLLSTDEAIFTRDGVFNSHSAQLWCDVNPHAIHERNFQDRFSVNIWTGGVENQLMDPYVLPRRLTADASCLLSKFVE